MKKFLAFILALACALSLMACGKKNNDDKPDPDPAPEPKPAVTTAEFTHGYVDMALDLPEGWSWEQVSDNGTDKTEGIRFYKTDDPTVSYTLLCWTGGYGICGTGVTEQDLTLSGGQRVWQYTEGGQSTVWVNIAFQGVPGSYVCMPDDNGVMGSAAWDGCRDEVLAILGTAQIGRGILTEQQAIELAETLRPDVVFLDVEMPEMTGVECARVIQDMNPAILLIFATAHEGYMGDAFEVYAFDYLVKPFKVERVMQTLERARNLLRSPETAPEPARPPLSRPRVEGRMMLHHRGGVSFLSFEDIVLIQREERSTVLYTADGSRYVTGDSLGDMEERLPPDLFFRCHKSYIVNLNKIRDITPYGRWTYAARLEGIPQDALITREKYDELERMFQQE